jgi:hypothetical protein
MFLLNERLLKTRDHRARKQGSLVREWPSCGPLVLGQKPCFRQEEKRQKQEVLSGQARDGFPPRRAWPQQQLTDQVLRRRLEIPVSEIRRQ